MKKKKQELRLSQIVLNQGQLDWLPRNPRTWTQQDIDRTAASIEEDPDFLEDRPLLVVPLDEVIFLTFAGNLRHEGCIYNGRETAPCVIYYPETEEDRQTVIRRAMKDNGSFGSWDTDVLGSDWKDVEFGDWGIPDFGGSDSEEQPGEEMETKDLKAYKKHHILLSYDITRHAEVVEALSAIMDLKFVEIETAAN